MVHCKSLLLALVAVLLMINDVRAQAPVISSAEPVVMRAPEELDQLVGPIALYPDPLIAEILPASTQPSQIVLADQDLAAGMDAAQIDLQPLDPSVKALARDPDLLRWLDNNLAWTTQLGQAFLYQQPDVMNSIQRLRARALALGNLSSTPQQTVINENGQIEIVPANPQVVYVPVYQPEVVYVERPPRPGAFVTFGFGLPVGVWLNHDFDWAHHQVVVWRHDHPRPADWWFHRPGEHRQEPIAVGATSWRPRSSYAVSERDREFRGWGPAPTHAAPAPRVTERVPVRSEVVREQERREPERRPIPPREPAHPPEAVHPEPAHRETEHAAVVARPAPRPAVTQRPAEPRNQPARPAVAPAARPANGALIGVQSTPETHAYSNRGQQSRAAATGRAPASAAPAVAAPPPTHPVNPSQPTRTPAAGERQRR